MAIKANSLLVLNYLKENCPSLKPYEYQPWTPEITQFVNSCIQVYSNPQASMQAATGQPTPYMAQPAMTPQVVQTTQVPQMPTTGLQIGTDSQQMNQTTPGGFGTSSIPGLNTGEIDDILNQGMPSNTPPANPTAGLRLDDVLGGLMA